MIDQKEFKNLFKYDQETGMFFRNNPVSNIKAGLVNLKPSKYCYLRLRINGKYYYLHRLAWIYVHGYFQKNLIDHKDGNKQNNCINNLREADHRGNFQNLAKKSQAASGFRGAYFDKKSGLFQSKLTLNYKSISLGYFKTAIEAHHAYIDGKKKHHKFNP